MYSDSHMKALFYKFKYFVQRTTLAVK